MQEEYHLDLPRPLQIEFSRIVQSVTDESGLEISSQEIWDLFEKEYLGRNGRFDLVEHRMAPDTHASDRVVVTGTLLVDGETRIVTGDGNGPIDAYTSALARDLGVEVSVLDYKEHATGHGANATAVAYVEVRAAGRRLPVRGGDGPQHRDGFAPGGDERGEPAPAQRRLAEERSQAKRSGAKGARSTLGGEVPSTSSAISLPEIPPRVMPRCWWPNAQRMRGSEGSGPNRGQGIGQRGPKPEPALGRLPEVGKEPPGGRGEGFHAGGPGRGVEPCELHRPGRSQPPLHRSHEESAVDGGHRPVQQGRPLGKHDVIAPLGVERNVVREPAEKPLRPRAGGDHHPVRQDAFARGHHLEQPGKAAADRPHLGMAQAPAPLHERAGEPVHHRVWAAQEEHLLHVDPPVHDVGEGGAPARTPHSGPAPGSRPRGHAAVPGFRGRAASSLPIRRRRARRRDPGATRSLPGAREDETPPPPSRGSPREPEPSPAPGRVDRRKGKRSAQGRNRGR